MGASETKIVYQEDIKNAFPAGEINLDDACQVIKCTPTPKTKIEDFTNYNKKNNYWFLLLFLLLFIFLIHIT